MSAHASAMGGRASPSGTRVPPALAAAIAFPIALLVFAQGITAPFVKDAEPQAAEWIQDVADGRHILVPHDYYGELARKPPLFYWIAGAVTVASGGHVDETRARAVSLVAAAAIAVEVLMWSDAFLGAATGWLAFLFLLGSYAFASRGTLALEDMLLVLFMFSAWCLLYPTIEEGPSSSKTVAIGILLGLGILTKGPVAIVLPALGALIYLLMARRSILETARQPWPWIVLAIAAVIALPWYIPALLSNGGELAKIIFQENAGHFLPATAGGTGEAARPFYYITMRMVGGVIPLSLLIPALAAGFWRDGFTPSARRPLLFQVCFVLAVLILFSAASAKRDDYVLPGIPSLAMLFAALFTSLPSPSETHVPLAARLRDLGAIVAAVAMLGAVAVAFFWISLNNNPGSLVSKMVPVDRAAVDLFLGYVRGHGPIVISMAAVVMLGAALVFVGFARRHPQLTGAGIGILSLLGVLVFTAVIRPELNRRRTLKYAAAEVARIVDGASVYGLTEEYELSFYLGRAVPKVVRKHQIVATEAPAFLFAYKMELANAPQSLKSRLALVHEWNRIGRAGAGGLYRIEPAAIDLKPAAARDK